MSLDLIRVSQDRQKGSAVGFSELERLLDERQRELEEIIKQQDNQQQGLDDNE